MSDRGRRTKIAHPNQIDDTENAKREALVYNGDASIRVAVASQFTVKLFLFFLHLAA